MRHGLQSALGVAASVCGIFSGCRDPHRFELPVEVPKTPSELIVRLTEIYRRRDLAAYATLFPSDAEAPFLFLFEPDPGDPAPTQWDRTEELRIHQRMFAPQDTLPGEPGVQAELWPLSISIVLSVQTDFVEQPDLYASTANPGGLDPARWGAFQAIFSTNVYWDLQGETDFQVTGRARFVVLVDRQKPLGQAGKCLLYRWEDLGDRGSSSAASRTTWTDVKRLYR